MADYTKMHGAGQKVRELLRTGTEQAHGRPQSAGSPHGT
jgi:hypothetical protein